MAKFNSNNIEIPKWNPSHDTVMTASAAVENLVKWQYCDCGCPNQRSPAGAQSVDFLRIAAFIRVELLS